MWKRTTDGETFSDGSEPKSDLKEEKVVVEMYKQEIITKEIKRIEIRKPYGTPSNENEEKQRRNGSDNDNMYSTIRTRRSDLLGEERMILFFGPEDRKNKRKALPESEKGMLRKYGYSVHLVDGTRRKDSQDSTEAYGTQKVMESIERGEHPSHNKKYQTYKKVEKRYEIRLG